jgi:hypothetical protein
LNFSDQLSIKSGGGRVKYVFLGLWPKAKYQKNKIWTADRVKNMCLMFAKCEEIEKIVVAVLTNSKGLMPTFDVVHLATLQLKKAKKHSSMKSS